MENLVPQPDGTYALTFKNYQKIPEDEVREIFIEYGDVVNIRRSSEQVPWVFVRYKSYDEALKAYRSLQNCDRFDIRVATSGKKLMDKGSDEREKATKGEAQEKGASKAGRSRNFPKNRPREVVNEEDVSRNQMRITGYSKHFSKNSHREVDDDDDQGDKRSQIQISGHSRKFSTNSVKEVDDDLEGKRNHAKLSGRNHLKTSPKEINDFYLKGKRSHMEKMPLNRVNIPKEDDWEDNEDVGVEAVGNSLKQLSVHGVVRHRKGNYEDGEMDVKSCDEGPPKLVKATEFYGALTLQHPYESGLASRAVFNEVWTNHPLRKEMELHEVVIANFGSIPTKNDIKRLCSDVTLLHVSIDVTPMNIPYCRILVATEEDADKLYQLDGVLFDGLQLYVSSLGCILDELAE